MPDFIDRLGAELRRAASGEPLPPRSQAGAARARPAVFAWLSTHPDRLRLGGRARVCAQARHELLNHRLGRFRRPGAPVYGAIATGAVALAAVLLLITPATEPAYALTRNADGSITVTIHDLQTALPALNARLAALGAHTRIVPVEGSCPAGNPALGGALMVYPRMTATDTITIGTGSREPGYTNVVAAEQLPNGEVALVLESTTLPVPSCFPTTVYILRSTGRVNNGIPIYQFVPADPTSTSTSSSPTPPSG